MEKLHYSDIEGFKNLYVISGRSYWQTDMALNTFQNLTVFKINSNSGRSLRKIAIYH